MKPLIEKLLSEMIYFADKRKCKETDIYLKKAYEKLDKILLFSRVRNLLSWIDPKFHVSQTDLKKYLLYEDFMDPEDFEEVYAEFSLLFEYIPALKEIFALKEQHIEFNEFLTEDDIQEIYEYIRINKVIRPENVTRYYGLKE